MPKTIHYQRPCCLTRNAVITIIFSVLLTLGFSQSQSQSIPDGIKTSKTVMKGFMDLRFGMFMHWGPVSLRGTEIGWSRNQQVQQQDYDSLYKEFDPVLFNADDLIRTARDAGMKYFVLTTKHHDGFCLWPSAFTSYNITATPYKKDILRPFADACKKYNVKLCFYYSVLDWHHPNYPIHNPYKPGNISPEADMDKYVVYMKNQLKELVTRYKPYMLWFDGPWEKPWTQQYGYDIYAFLKSLDKNLIINNRLDKGMVGLEPTESVMRIGDFDTPEQRVGNMNMDTPWESCITIAKQWAWKPNDTVKSVKTCIQTLVRSAAGNGNLLFNVGPMMDGRIEARQVERLKEMGKWLSKYGGAIYSTNGGPYSPNEIYAATRKGNRIYLHVFERKAATLELPPLPGVKIMKAFFMNGKPVVFKQEAAASITIELPETLPDAISSVIVLELDKDAGQIPVIKK